MRARVATRAVLAALALALRAPPARADLPSLLAASSAVPNPSKVDFAVGAAAAAATNVASALKNAVNTATINRTAAACGAARIKTLQEYFASVYPLASKPAADCIDWKSPQNDLRFFYDNAPKLLLERVGGQADFMPAAPRIDNAPAPEYDFSPPKLWAPYSVFAGDNCTFFINHYPPNAWWTFADAAGAPAGASIEVTHVKVGNTERRGSADPARPFNATTETGFFFYYAPGSGVYYNVGQTIVAANKLAMLNALGMPFDAMAAALWVAGNQFFPGQATAGTHVSITTAYAYMSPSAAAFTPAQLLEIGAYGKAGRDGNLPPGFAAADLYLANRLANNFYVDALIAARVKARAYDSAQYTVQPNSDGGWAWEVVAFVPPTAEASVTTWGAYIAFVAAGLSTRDPCRGEFDVVPPSLPAGAASLNPAGACTFSAAAYYCIYCDAQSVKLVCGDNRPYALVPP